ncbi:MAG: hypothetical protein AAF741_10855, partial [Bacteroidota bacterium]
LGCVFLSIFTVAMSALLGSKGSIFVKVWLPQKYCFPIFTNLALLNYNCGELFIAAHAPCGRTATMQGVVGY